MVSFPQVSPPVPILSQLHPFPTTPPHFLNIHLNIILDSIIIITQNTIKINQINHRVFPILAVFKQAIVLKIFHN
jgi:hypothetical protein